MAYIRGLKTDYPLLIEKKYNKEMIRLVDDIFIIILGDLVLIKDSYNKEIRTDDFSEDFNRVIKFSEFKISLKLKEFVTKILKTAQSLNNFNKKAVEKSLGNIAKATNRSVSIGTTEKVNTALEVFVSDNVRLIKSISSNLLGDIQEVIYSGVRRGVTFRSLSSELQEKFKIAKKRSDLIAKDQIIKAYSDLTRARHLSAGIKFYKWSTSKDERVRPSHKIMEDKICFYEDVFVYKDNVNDKKWLKRENLKLEKVHATLYHPGQEILCRCTARPLTVLDDRYRYMYE